MEHASQTVACTGIEALWEAVEVSTGRDVTRSDLVNGVLVYKKMNSGHYVVLKSKLQT